jgi:hypothetical protein
LKIGTERRNEDGEFEQVREIESASSGVVTFRCSTVKTRNEQINRE